MLELFMDMRCSYYWESTENYKIEYSLLFITEPSDSAHKEATVQTIYSSTNYHHSKPSLHSHHRIGNTSYSRRFETVTSHLPSPNSGVTMASSSVSQESIEIEDYDLCTRRSRIRMMRGRTTAGAHTKTEYHESMESGDHRWESLLFSDTVEPR